MEQFLIGADNSPIENQSKGKKAQSRKYDDKFLEYGFTQTRDLEDSRPQCVICSEVLTKESLKPSKMLRHLTTKHESLQSKPLKFFQRKLQELHGRKSLIQKDNTVNERALHTSSIISH